MSLCNWYLRPARVEIVTDTLAYDRHYTGLFNTTKFFTLPHARLVISDVGAAVEIFELQRRMLNCDLSNGIDDVAARGPNWMRQIHADFLAEYGEVVDMEKKQHLWNVVAFGYSESRGRVMAYFFNTIDDFRPQEVPDGDAFNPPLTAEFIDRTDGRVQKVWRQHASVLTRFKSPDSFIAGAKLQQLAAERVLGGGIGGDLIMATLTRDRLEVRKLWSFPALDSEPPAAPTRLDVRLKGDTYAAAS